MCIYFRLNTSFQINTSNIAVCLHGHLFYNILVRIKLIFSTNYNKINSLKNSLEGGNCSILLSLNLYIQSFFFFFTNIYVFLSNVNINMYVPFLSFFLNSYN